MVERYSPNFVVFLSLTGYFDWFLLKCKHGTQSSSRKMQPDDLLFPGLRNVKNRRIGICNRVEVPVDWDHEVLWQWAT